MDQEVSLKAMILAFRVTELQTLLSYAGKNRSGRKNELQARAMELMKSNKSTVNAKIRELYQTIQLSNLAQQPPASTGIINSGTPLGGTTASGLLQQQRQSPYNNSNLNRIYPTSAYTGAADKVLQGRGMYTGNWQSVGVNSVNRVAAVNSMPICPDVQLKKLPFYDILAVLYKPTTLIANLGHRGVQDALFSFSFKPSEASQVSSSKEINLGLAVGPENKLQYAVQVQLRFCVADSSGTDQDDAFPPSLVVKVNGKMIPLPPPIPSNRPGVEPKRPSRPLNVTNYCRLSPIVQNNVQVNWSPDPSGKSYCISLYIVKKLCSKDLLSRLKAKGSRPADFTRGMIKEICQKDDSDCCVATTSLKVSLACPLGKSRMAIPCRASTCSHLQCFDANLFIQMNEKKPTWVCPVCDKPTLFDNLGIDGYFADVISKVPIAEGNDIEISPDAEWSVAIKNDEPPVKKSRTTPALAKSANKTICLDDDIMIDDEDDDDDDVIDQTPKASEKSSSSGKENSKPEKPCVDIVDLTSSTDDEAEEVIAATPSPAHAKSPVKKSDHESVPAPLPPHKKIIEDTSPPPQKEKEREGEREISPGKASASASRSNGKKDSQGDEKDSSDEEDNIRPVRRMPNRQARPTFLHDESSSNSNSSDSSASTRAPDSPQCITLESDSSSRSPSPEPRQSSRGRRTSQHDSGSKGSSGGGGGSGSASSAAVNSFLSSGSVFAGGSGGGSGASSQQSSSTHTQAAAAAGSSNYSTSLSYPNTNALPNPRYNDGGYSGSGGYQSGAAYRAANAAAPPSAMRQPLIDPYSASYGMPGYDSWDPNTFGSVTDFGSLDFPSMEYFNQGPSYGSSTSHTGANSNYNGRGGYTQQWR